MGRNIFWEYVEEYSIYSVYSTSENEIARIVVIDLDGPWTFMPE